MSGGEVRAELLKLFSTRLWWGLLLGVVVTSAAFAGLLAATAGQDVGQGLPSGPLEDPATVRTIYTAGLGLSYIFSLALGVIAMAGEFRNGTMTGTALAVPHRPRIVLAKLAALLVVGALYGVAAVVTGVVVGGSIVAARGADVLPAGAELGRALPLAVLAVALWAVIGLGVGTLIRNQVLALMLAVGIAWLAEPLITLLLNAVDLGAIGRYMPSAATSAIADPIADNGTGVSYELLPWWGGALVLLAYAAVSAGLGTALTLRRDIT